MQVSNHVSVLNLTFRVRSQSNHGLELSSHEAGWSLELKTRNYIKWAFFTTLRYHNSLVKLPRALVSNKISSTKLRGLKETVDVISCDSLRYQKKSRMI